MLFISRNVFISLTAAMMITQIAGCGGGGGTQPHNSQPKPPSVSDSGLGESATPTLSLDNVPYPVFHQQNTVYVGTNALAVSAGMENVFTQNGITVFKGTQLDGTSEADVLAMFADITPAGTEDFIEREVIFPITFPTYPTVQVVRGAQESFKTAVLDAVSIINSVLPWNKQMQFDDTLIAAPNSLSDVPNDYIYVEHTQPSEWIDDIDQNTIGPFTLGLSLRKDKLEDVTLPNNYTLAGWTGVNVSAQISNTNLRHVIVHELLHHLGFWGHSDGREFPDSVLNETLDGSRNRFVLSSQDKDMIHAAYTRVEPGVVEAVDITSLGPWSRRSSHLMGMFDTDAGATVTFGVFTRNGLIQPWAQGPAPRGLLQDASFAADDRARWKGVFLGYARSHQEVTGDAYLEVQLSDLTAGDLTFTDLKDENDQRWRDGDLAYRVNISSGTFGNHGVSDSEDVGDVTGVFLGADYKAMAGVLRREDLSGGFGGRQP